MGLENRIVYDLVHVIEGECRLRQALIKDKRTENLCLLPAAQTRDKNAVTPDEVQFAYGRDLEFVDLESGATITVDALAARRDYTDAFAAFLERSRRRARAEGFSYTLMLTDQPHHRVLRNFLLQRSIRGRTPSALPAR